MGMSAVLQKSDFVFHFPGDHGRRHGGTAGLRFGQRPRLCGDRCPEGSAGSRTSGLLQVGEASDDPHEKPLGREGVERPLERQVNTALSPAGHGDLPQLL